MSISEVMGLTFFPQQWRAVTAAPGPILVLAGPGAGKTRCLTGRIAYLLHEGADPRRICAITFTNKAAQEIATRLHHGLGDLAEQMTLGTIHSLCLRILRPHGRGVGLPVGFGVADQDHQQLVLGRLGVPSRRHRSLLMQFGRRRLQGQPLTPADEELFWRYQRELRSNHLIDYDEILSLTLALLETDAAVRAHWQETWDHLLVDEFQDLDRTQYTVLRLLADRHHSLFAVGDDEQSIFTWRGAEPRVMEHFVRDFAVAAPVILDVNCRCSQAIFAAARRVLPAAEPLFKKQILAVRDSPHPVRVLACADELEETAHVLADLKADLAVSGLSRGEYGILYRTHQIGQQFEEALLAEGIPCQLAKGQSLADDKVIAQLLASLRIVANPDADLHVENLARKLLPETLLAEVRKVPGETLLARLRGHAEQPGAADADRCWRFLYQVENLKGLRRLHGSLSDLVDAVLAQGVGQLDGPLEPRHALLRDPEEVTAVRHLADQLLRAADRGGRVLLTPAGGLEVPVKVMIRRALPDLAVEYLDAAVAPGADDLLLTLRPIHLYAGDSVSPGQGPGRLRIVQVFKALQAIEGRRFRKSFPAYVAFDTETTGLDINRCEVIELAGARVRDGRVTETFRSLVRCERSISPGATAVHGYTDADLRGQPSLAEVWPRFRAFVGDDILVVHNGRRFDVPLLERLTAAWEGTKGLVFLDTLPLARNLLPGSLKLEDLAVRFGVQVKPNHHALDDSLCLAEVFERLQEERLRRCRKTCRADLLDCVALGAVLEERRPLCPEDEAIVEAGRWRDLRRPPAIVDAYAEEVERFGLRCPPLEELLERLGGWDEWPGSGEPAPRDRYPESYARLTRLLALVKAGPLDEAIQELLDRAALSTSEGYGVNQDRVSLLTFHATKGLEFSRVYLAGVEDNQVLGYAGRTEASVKEMHEARRLVYVAMTRARDRLILTHCRERYGKPGGGATLLDEMGLAATPAALCGR